MKTFQNIDEFIMETFPLEYEKIIKQRKTFIEESIENINDKFDQELEKIIKGKKENEPDKNRKAGGIQ
jgi:hypothetical protein